MGFERNSYNGQIQNGNNKDVDDKEGKMWDKIISLNQVKRLRIMVCI